MKNLKRKPQSTAEVSQPDPLLAPEQRKRQRQAGALVLKWAEEDDGYDEAIWPLVEEELGLKK